MKVELCASTVQALIEAQKLGVDRVELCSCLEQGGLTPSMGFVEFALDLGLECHVLLRPRAGGFVYSPAEFALILQDLSVLSNTSVKGIVVGALTSKNQVDREALIEIRNRWTKTITFHRAFDDLVEWESDLSWLLSIGVDRVLSSGIAHSVETGIPILQKMMKLANGKMEIMAGGGVNLSNISKIIEKVTPDAVHFSATNKQPMDEGSKFSDIQWVFDPIKAKKLVEACRNFR